MKAKASKICRLSYALGTQKSIKATLLWSWCSHFMSVDNVSPSCWSFFLFVLICIRFYSCFLPEDVYSNLLQSIPLKYDSIFVLNTLIMCLRLRLNLSLFVSLRRGRDELSDDAFRSFGQHWHWPKPQTIQLRNPFEQHKYRKRIELSNVCFSCTKPHSHFSAILRSIEMPETS